MYKIILIIVGLFSHLNAYELPTVELTPNNQPKIILFNATSVKVGDKLSYNLKWKTINADDVTITFIGKVALSGDFIITEDEYNRGAITLKASSKHSNYVDIVTINDYGKNLPPPIKFKKEKEPQIQPYYDNMRYRGIGRPIDRRRYY